MYDISLVLTAVGQALLLAPSPTGIFVESCRDGMLYRLDIDDTAAGSRFAAAVVTAISLFSVAVLAGVRAATALSLSAKPRLVIAAVQLVIAALLIAGVSWGSCAVGAGIYLQLAIFVSWVMAAVMTPSLPPQQETEKKTNRKRNIFMKTGLVY